MLLRKDGSPNFGRKMMTKTVRTSSLNEDVGRDEVYAEIWVTNLMVTNAQSRTERKNVIKTNTVRDYF